MGRLVGSSRGPMVESLKGMSVMGVAWTPLLPGRILEGEVMVSVFVWHHLIGLNARGLFQKEREE